MRGHRKEATRQRDPTQRSAREALKFAFCEEASAPSTSPVTPAPICSNSRAREGRVCEVTKVQATVKSVNWGQECPYHSLTICLSGYQGAGVCGPGVGRGSPLHRWGLDRRDLVNQGKARPESREPGLEALRKGA